MCPQVFGFNPACGFAGTLLRLPLRIKSDQGGSGNDAFADQGLGLEQFEDMMMVSTRLVCAQICTDAYVCTCERVHMKLYRGMMVIHVYTDSQRGSAFTP
jgi:hypothetical protein